MALGKVRRRSLALIMGLLVPAAVIGLYNGPTLPRGVKVIDIRATAPEAGGFVPDAITVRAGQRVRLRFHASDVAHGVAIGPGLGIDLGDLAPGESRTIAVTVDQPGTYTFYCNKWCSPNHWRMRGVLQVVPQRKTEAVAPAPVLGDPVIDRLSAEGVDIDAFLTGEGHNAAHAEPVASPTLLPPDPGAGEAQAARLQVPPELRDEGWQRRHTPLEAEALLAAANPEVEDQALADTVAYLWMGSRTSAQLETASVLYAKNCAACHGERGAGDGFAAGVATTVPPSLADPQRMAGRRGDVLYAKIRRGGMGTGMPNFGTLFTPEETWDLVEYLWHLTYNQ